jgi:outer membrane protein OmpA-like peptidoglycan-associated protein
LTCEQELTGIVTDDKSGTRLSEVRLSLYDDKYNIIKHTIANDNGEYRFEVECGEKYYVRSEKRDYETKENTITIPKSSGESKLAFELEKRIKTIGVGGDLAKTLGIEIIYFDLDKSFIRKDAAFELEKIVAVMKAYPNLKIDVRSHTDSRQTAQYNESLSDRRAKSTRQWLIINGIEEDRLTAKGYGESQLLNKCADGVICSETEHQLNRRSEFIIISM